jgi:type I restriction enzyme R subunit
MNITPEQKARLDIDAALEAAGWILQNRDAINLAAGSGVAVREAKMASGHGFADYLLFVNGKAVGAIEAKPAGLNPAVTPLPFVYMSTGVETRFINGLDPDPRTRAISANLPHIQMKKTGARVYSPGHDSLPLLIWSVSHT